MNLVGKVPVEPLDEERLTNIERKLVVQVSEMSQRPMRSPRRVLAFAGVVTAVAAAGFVGWKLHRDPVVEPAKPEQLAMKAGALDLGDAQITGTDFDVTRTATLTVIEMHPGKLDLHVEHEVGRVFVVKAGDVEIEDIGTRFTVDYDGKNVDVRVTEGEVKVKRAGKEQMVAAGNAWTLEIGPITIAALEKKQADDALAAVMADPTHPEVMAPEQPANEVAAGSGSAGATTGSNGATTGSNGASQGSAAHKPGKKSNARQALEKRPYEAPLDVGTEDPKAAITAYLNLAKQKPQGDANAQVLYGIAVMQYRLKQDEKALYTLDGVLKRQGGSAYKAALWLDVHIRCDKTFDDDCRIAVAKYLAKFDSGFEAGVADEILKEISRGP